MTVAFAPVKSIQATRTSHRPGFPAIGIAGSGPALLTMACYLSGRGYPVQVLDRTNNIPGPAASVKAEGAISGQYDQQTFSLRPEDVLSQCAHLIIVAPPSTYKELVWSISPWMRAKHTVLLYGGGIGASMEFEKRLLNNGVSGVKVAEMDPLFHAERYNNATIKVHAMRQWGQFASTSPATTFDCDSAIKRLFPKVEPAANLLSRGLCDYQAIVYPVIEAFGADAEMSSALLELINSVSEADEKCSNVFDQLESELNSIADAYSTARISTTHNIRRMYGAIAATPAQAVSMVPKYGQAAPWQDMIRTLGEIVSTVYVPLYELSRLANLRTPAIDSVINMSAVMCGVDFLTHGRTLNRLGLQGLSQREIIRKLNG
ncbi:MAG: NAD(P)/FAD-dependent oxidoreductase [Candidatus Obscuribacterales bacterium]|nr:NAD(P)/FAD-dependent oxidoreductase [Candidatus Obscuribacterales bacterium]